MKKQSKFQIDSTPLVEAVRNAVDEDHMSLSDIADRAGLSVPTIGRIYSQAVTTVQAKTARMIAEALGYEVNISRGGELRLQKMAEKPHSDQLTTGQKRKILRAFEKLLDEL